MNRNIWTIGHYYSARYPHAPTDTDKKNAYEFFRLLGEMHPCNMCRSHYKVMFDKTPPDLNNRFSLFKWFFDRHNEVNVRLHKKAYPLEKAMADYKF